MLLSFFVLFLFFLLLLVLTIKHEFIINLFVSFELVIQLLYLVFVLDILQFMLLSFTGNNDKTVCTHARMKSNRYPVVLHVVWIEQFFSGWFFNIILMLYWFGSISNASNSLHAYSCSTSLMNFEF